MTVEQMAAVKHLAVVMDGNQRWARARGLPGPKGHAEGAKAVKRLVKAAVKSEIKHLTLFAFSSENWRRPPHEIELLMALFCSAIDEQLPELHENEIRLLFLGDLDKFSPLLREKMTSASAKTRQNTGLHLVIAVNYGGQWDIAEAAKGLARVALESSLSQLQNSDPDMLRELYDQNLQQMTQDDLARHLNLELPPVDLFIRTSGEQRISNFLLWQLAYAELYFTDTYWPDFDEAALTLALDDFARRQRRYGQSSEALLQSKQDGAGEVQHISGSD